MSGVLRDNRRWTDGRPTKSEPFIIFIFIIRNSSGSILENVDLRIQILVIYQYKVKVICPTQWLWRNKNVIQGIKINSALVWIRVEWRERRAKCRWRRRRWSPRRPTIRIRFRPLCRVREREGERQGPGRLRN